MQIQVDNALVLEIKEETFKGRDGKEVNFKKIRFIDDQNVYHEATLSKEVELNEDVSEYNRFETNLILEIEERNRNGNTSLYKKVTHLVN